MSPTLGSASRAAALIVCLTVMASLREPTEASGPGGRPPRRRRLGPRPTRTRFQPPAPVGETSESGSPVPGSARDFVINVGDRVYFDFDQYAVRADAPADAGRPGRLAEPLSRGAGARSRAIATRSGTREYNFALGARRANSVREYLAGRGVSLARIETVSYGKEHPDRPAARRKGPGQEPQRPHRHHQRRAVASHAGPAILRRVSRSWPSPSWRRVLCAGAQVPLDPPLDERSAARLDRMEKAMRELRAIVFQGRETGQPVVVQPADTSGQINALTDRLNDLDRASPA